MRELFEKSQNELIELTIVSRIWVLFITLQQKIVKLFEIEIETDVSCRKMIKDEEDGKMLMYLIKTLTQNSNEKPVNNAA